MSLEIALEKITAQQPKERDNLWSLGEHLKDILRSEPHLAELVAQDLDVKEMSLAECEKKIGEFADQHKPKGKNRFCVGPAEAERIIREFYGLPARGETPKPVGNRLMSLEDFF